MAVPERAAPASRIRARLAAEAGAWSHPILHFDKRGRGPGPAQRDILSRVKERTGFHLVVQDDVQFGDAVLFKVDHILRNLPEDCYGAAFYAPRNAKVAEVYRKGGHLIRTSTALWGQAIAHRVSEIPAFVEFYETRLEPGYRSSDRSLCLYLHTARRYLYVVVPGLFQHDLSKPSTLGTGAKAFGVPRNSPAYEPGFNPEGVDWIEEAARAERFEIVPPKKGLLPP